MAILRLELGKISSVNDYDELVRMFLPRGSYELIYELQEIKDSKEKRENLKRDIYLQLVEITGKTLPWGILTGVKPVKLFAQLVENCSNKNPVGYTRKVLEDFYYVEDSKIQLVADTYSLEKKAAGFPPQDTVSLYVGIPYCPSVCHYCSFSTEIATPGKIELYLVALEKEIKAVGAMMKKAGLNAECIYMGGGTPTVISPKQMEKLLRVINTEIPKYKSINNGFEYEFTVEAGRPETLDKNMCKVLSLEGVSRISINAQTMSDEILERIGRNHTSHDIEKAFLVAEKSGFSVINTDLIAGLPGETEESFNRSLERVIALSPENITVHSLAIKKGSKFIEDNMELAYEGDGKVSAMLDSARIKLTNLGYAPYYLYRQKLTVDSMENIGYSVKLSENLYNIRIMQEKQSIIALGAGGVSKLYFPEKDRIERVFNVKDPGGYISRIDEMITRKAGAFEALAEKQKNSEVSYEY